MISHLNKSLILFSALILLQACGSNRAPDTSSHTDVNSMPKTPEAHGSAEFKEVFKDEPTEPTPETKTTQTEAELPEELDLDKVEVSNRHPLCQDSFNPNSPIPEDVKCPTCQKGEFTQPAAKLVKLDVLFVADSSPSLETERTKIGKSIRQFIDRLPPGTDYRIAVLPAHSDVSYDPKNKRSTGLAGKLFVAGKEPAVLKKSSSLNEQLTRKLAKLPVDGASDGGELGLFSLDKAISGDQLAINQKLGFFRPDAGLSIIFISDENDICSYGEDVNYPAGVEPKKNVNMYLKTGLTVEQKANQVYCRNTDGSPKITSRSVFAKLRNLQKDLRPEAKENEARALIISGIIYTSEENVPTQPDANEKNPEYFGENEVGYGYKDIIADNGGAPVDINSGDFKKALDKIGEDTAKKLIVKSEFRLKDGPVIDPETLCVMVDGREVKEIATFDTQVDGLSYVFRPDLREVHVRGAGATNVKGTASKVEIFYCEPPTEIRFNTEKYSVNDMPTKGEHYRNLPVPSACARVKARINSGALD